MYETVYEIGLLVIFRSKSSKQSLATSFPGLLPSVL